MTTILFFYLLWPLFLLLAVEMQNRLRCGIVHIEFFGCLKGKTCLKMERKWDFTIFIFLFSKKIFANNESRVSADMRLYFLVLESRISLNSDSTVEVSLGDWRKAMKERKKLYLGRLKWKSRALKGYLKVWWRRRAIIGEDGLSGAISDIIGEKVNTQKHTQAVFGNRKSEKRQFYLGTGIKSKNFIEGAL